MMIEEIIANENIQELENYLLNNKLNVSQQRKIMKMIGKSKWNVDNFKGYSQTLNWYWFNINLLRKKDFNEAMLFIDNNLDYFTSWYCCDGTLCFIKRKNLSFDNLFLYAKKYISDEREFVCRFGYFLFFALEMDHKQIIEIAKLLKDDNRYYVQMMEAWLLCEMVVRNPSDGFTVLKDCKLKYNILGKAIQKCLDSFRINEELKSEIKALRDIKKGN